MVDPNPNPYVAFLRIVKSATLMKSKLQSRKIIPPKVFLRPNHYTSKMASLFTRGLRVAEPGVCRQCANLQTRRTFASLSQNPKREIRSRTTTLNKSSAPSKTASPWATLSRRGYKTVQEAKSRYKSGVSPLHSHCALQKNASLTATPPHSPSHGRQASSSSSPAAA